MFAQTLRQPGSLCRSPSSRQSAMGLQRQSLRQRRQRLRVQSLWGGKKDGEGGGGGGNPFANMGNLMENMKKAQQLVQVEAARVQEELASTEFEGYSDDETVRVVMSGNQEPRSVDFTDESLDAGPDKLAQLTLEAMKDAHSKSVSGMKTRMSELASRLGLPQGAGLGL